MHSCPDCGQACYCNGDVDDMDWGDDSDEALMCIHCLENDFEGDDDYEHDLREGTDG